MDLLLIFFFRYLAVLQPMRLYQMDRRGKLMIAVAWIASLVCSLPQVMRVKLGYVNVHVHYFVYTSINYRVCINHNFLLKSNSVYYPAQHFFIRRYFRSRKLRIPITTMYRCKHSRKQHYWKLSQWIYWVALILKIRITLMKFLLNFTFRFI